MYLRFRDIAPSKFYVDMQGTKKGTEYKGIPCISIVDLTRLERDIQDHPVTKKYNYEIDKFVKNFRSPPPPPRYNKGLIAELREAEKYELAASEDLTAGVVLTGKIQEALEDIEEEMILEASGVNIGSDEPTDTENQGERIRRKRRPKPVDFPWQNAYLI